ncbi:MAG TPA: Ppx/GppA phosphatase family protein [bacterium]|nr:Ppx/GppA phosphatase family protein [bacterium]
MKLGILDIGTNSIHLVLVEIGKDLSVQVIDRAKETTRLGDTSFQDGYLSETAIHRGISAVRRFKKLADIHNVARIKAVATSAVREAVNGGDFLEMIERETGISVDVITGEEEARLIYLAVKHSIPLPKGRPSLIVDIGGGSVECILVNGSDDLRSCWSLKLGTLRLKGEFLKNDPPTNKELEKLEDHIAETLEPVVKKAKAAGVETMIGTSGTIMNLVAMAHWLDQSGPIEIQNNFRIKPRYLRELHKILEDSDRKERQKIKGIDPARVDIILGGSAVVNHILKELKIEEVILCDEAIREGVVYDYLERNKSKIEMENTIPDMRLRSVMQLARSCAFEEEHSRHVEDLSLALFDQTKTLHQLGPVERELLRYAAILHDIGYHINYKKHHKHTYYLIKNGDLNGFEEREVELIANVARYHCKSEPKKTHDNWQRLSGDDKHVARILASILRIADGLDRSHFSVVKQLQCRLNGKGVAIEVTPSSDPELEIWGANKKKDLFEDLFNKKVALCTASQNRIRTRASSSSSKASTDRGRARRSSS